LLTRFGSRSKIQKLQTFNFFWLSAFFLIDLAE
jgi:hypothetical protein